MGVDLRIWLLGGFRATVDGFPVADRSWRRNKAKAVVKLLALASGHRLPREQLMELLWPDLAPEAAAGNLRMAVYFARQAPAPEHLRVHGEMLGLEAPRLWVDVEAFEAAAEARDLRTAVELYGGELLPEDRFEPWTEERRDRLHAWFARRLLERARELEAAGDVRAALAALERLAAVDPLSEEAAIGVIRAHALDGQRHLALRWYRQLETRLAEELGMEPGAEAQDPQLYGPQHALTLLEALVALEDWPSVDEFLPFARTRVAGNALLAPACDRAEGLAHAQAGRPAEAVRALRRALARFERLSVPFEAARTREDLAALEPPAAARPLLKAALSTYERLACTPRQDAAQTRLLALA